jgi:hypothetical protein
LKKLFSIALLSVFLFNVGGYYLVFYGLRCQAGMEMKQRLETEAYSNDETVTLTIPLAVPYYADNVDYEPVTGSFEKNGEFFKLVKQKFERDTLYVVCIKDHEEKRLFMAMTDLVKLFNHLPSSSQQTLKLLGSFIKDFTTDSTVGHQPNLGWIRAFEFPCQQFELLSSDFPVISPPPDFFV